MKNEMVLKKERLWRESDLASGHESLRNNIHIPSRDWRYSSLPSKWKTATLLVVCWMIAFSCLFGSTQGFATDRSSTGPETDPFADLSPKASSEIEQPKPSWTEKFFSENFGFRKELMLVFATADSDNSAGMGSIGFEILKKFSTDTKTFLSIDFQGRLFLQDGDVDLANDIEGLKYKGSGFWYQNAYADLYDLFGDVGSVNARIGHFFVPFGINLQTDTHATLLQLGNGRNFGFIYDWYTGFWGILSKDFNYDIYYELGSGYDLKFNGQSGLGAVRVSLAKKYLYEYGLEGGVSVIGGQRIDPTAANYPAVAASAGSSNIVNTFRVGLDGRYRKSISTGLLTFTAEISGGRDNPDPVFTQLYQLDYLLASRRFGLSTQFRWFWQNMSADQEISPSNYPASTDSSILAQANWYFSNDVSNSNLHWIALNCDVQLARQKGDKDVIWTLQYYRYW